MLRLPRFKYLRPRSAREAARMAAEHGPRAMFVAGGTDLYPKLKRRQFEIDTLIGLRVVPFIGLEDKPIPRTEHPDHRCLFRRRPPRRLS